MRHGAYQPVANPNNRPAHVASFANDVLFPLGFVLAAVALVMSVVSYRAALNCSCSSTNTSLSVHDTTIEFAVSNDTVISLTDLQNTISLLNASIGTLQRTVQSLLVINSTLPGCCVSELTLVDVGINSSYIQQSITEMKSHIVEIELELASFDLNATCASVAPSILTLNSTLSSLVNFTDTYILSHVLRQDRLAPQVGEAYYDYFPVCPMTQWEFIGSVGSAQLCLCDIGTECTR